MLGFNSSGVTVMVSLERVGLSFSTVVVGMKSPVYLRVSLAALSAALLVAIWRRRRDARMSHPHLFRRAIQIYL